MNFFPLQDKIYWYMYRRNQNIKCGGTKTPSSPPYSLHQIRNMDMFGINLQVRTTEFGPPWRFFNFPPWLEILAPKVGGLTPLKGQKIEKFFFFDFWLFFNKTYCICILTYGKSPFLSLKPKIWCRNIHSSEMCHFSRNLRY